jgi:phage protein D
MRGSCKTTRSDSWKAVPLSRIVADVSAWQPGADQFNESDFNVLTRLAKQYDCTTILKHMNQ